MTDITEQKETARPIWKGDEHYRAVIEASPLSILVAQDGKYVFANPAGISLLGYSDLDDVIGLSVPDTIAPENHDLARERLKNIKAGYSNPSVDMTLLRADGTRQEVESIAVPITLDGSAAALVFCQDITKRSLLKQALRESQFKYRTLVEQLPAVTYTASIDAASTSLFVSPQIETMLGDRPDDYRADPDIWRKRLHPDDRDRVLDEVYRAKASGESFFSEYRMIRRDERVVWIRDEATVIRNDRGEALFLQGVMFDITESKQALEDLSRRDAVLEAVNHAAGCFFADSKWSDSIGKILENLGAAADVSRVYVFENYTGPDSELWCRQIHEWTAEGVEAQADNPDLQGIPWKGAGMGRWAELMAKGETVAGLVGDFADSERAVLEPQDILSVLAIPVIVQGEWWGFIGFDECRYERSWAEPKVAVLQAAAHLLGSAIERQRSNKALLEREEHFRTIFERSPVGMTIVDLDYRLQRVNKAYCEMLGYSEGELQTLKFQDVTHPGDLEENLSQQARLSSGEISSYQMEKRFIRKDGKIAHGLLVASVLKDSADNPQCYLGQVLDITQRRQVEERSRLESRILRLLNQGDSRIDVIQEILDMIEEATGVDAVGIRLEEGHDFPYYCVSGFAAEFVGAERYLCARNEDGEIVRDVRGQPVLECMCGNVITGRIDRTQPFFTAGGSFWTNSTTDLLATAPPEILETVTRGRCPVEGYESMALIPLRSGDRTIGLLQLNYRRRDMFTREMVEFFEGLGNSIGLALSRKLAEEERLQAAEKRRRLEHQLRQSQKMEAIGVLAGGIAHDFNNLLHGIMGYTQFVLDTLPEGDRNIEYLNAVLTGGEQAADLIKQIRTFSRQAERVRKPLHLHIVVRETLKLLRGSLPSTITIRENLGLYCDVVLADPVQIKQVVMNLGTNAYNAMRADGGKLEVSLDQIRLDHRTAPKLDGLGLGPHVRLTVRDSGRGMDRETVDHIFEPYFTTGETTGGTGLGLAVVHGIVKSHDAAITVDSQPGRGTTFRIYFPVCATPDTEQVIEIPDEHLIRGSERILFVDDEETHVRLARIGLGSLGYSIVACTSPDEAFELFKKEPKSYDLVITDLAMPKVSGLQFAEKLRKVRSKIPILLCTGLAERIDEQRARRAGIGRCIMKPVTYPEIARAIREMLPKS